MNTKSFFNQKKDIYISIINYLENGLSNKNEENNEEENKNEVVFQNKDEFREFLMMLSKISKNHHRDSFFTNRIDAIISHFEDQIKQTFTNLELFKIFKKNFQIILLLSKKQILFFDDSIYKYTQTKINKSLYHFFYPEIKSFLSETKRKQIENEIVSYDSDAFLHFDEKRKIGENDSHICQLIRSDSIDDFIIYVNRNSINYSSTINTSIFETNPFLLKNNKTSLIEYAAFYGSIQIFQYLKFSKAELSERLWLYAIHGKNGELIHLLEENRIFPEYKSYYKCLQESIKCHHNDIVTYINDKYINQTGKITNFEDNIFAYSFHYHNYKFMPNDLNEHVFISYYLCQYDYMSIVNFMLNNKSFDIKNKIIFNQFIPIKFLILFLMKFL